MRQSETRLKLALQATRLGVWEWDPKTNVVYWSAECFEITGTKDTGQQLKMDDFTRWLHPEDAARVLAAVDQALQKRADFVCEFRILQPGVPVRWLVNYGRLEFDASGAPVRMTGTVQDISERKRTEAALRESELNSRLLFENMNDAFFLAEPLFDSSGKPVDWRFLQANSAYSLMTGFPISQVIGRLNSELFPSRGALLV